MGDWSVKQSLREDILEAVEFGDRVRVEELLDKGADVDESRGAYLSGNTLLTLAVEKDYVDIAELLIDRGADIDVNLKINNNTDIEQHANAKEMTSLAMYIKKKRELNMQLRDSVQYGDVAGVTSAVMEGADVNLLTRFRVERICAATLDGNSTMNLLFLALIEGHFDAAKILVENEVNLNYVVKWEDDRQDTALSYVKRMDQPEMVKLIQMKQAGQTTTEFEHNDRTPQPNGTTNHVNTDVTMDDVDAEKEFQKLKLLQQHRQTKINRPDMDTHLCSVLSRDESILKTYCGMVKWA